MEMDKAAFLCISVILFNCISYGVCTLGSEPNKTSDSACFGTNNENYTVISLSCDAGSVIAIDSIMIGAQKSTSGCPTSYVAGREDCCAPSATRADDCIFALDTAVNQLYHGLCNGRNLCDPQAQNDPLTDVRCGKPVADYPLTTHYMFVNYFCVEEARIESMCTGSFPRTVYDSAVYLTNDGFPISSFQSSADCTCSVESDNCEASIQVVTIQRELTGTSNTTCDQKFSIADENGTEIVRWDCSSNTVTLDTVSTLTHYVTIDLQNNRTVDDGKMWLGFFASDAVNLTVNCPATFTSACLPTTLATTHVATTPATGPVSSPSEVSHMTPESTASNNERDYIIIIVAVGAGAIIILVTIVGLCFYCGVCRKKDLGTEEKPVDDENMFQESSSNPANTKLHHETEETDGKPMSNYGDSDATLTDENDQAEEDKVAKEEAETKCVINTDEHAMEEKYCLNVELEHRNIEEDKLVKEHDNAEQLIIEVKNEETEPVDESEETTTSKIHIIKNKNEETEPIDVNEETNTKDVDKHAREDDYTEEHVIEIENKETEAVNENEQSNEKTVEIDVPSENNTENTTEQPEDELTTNVKSLSVDVTTIHIHQYESLTETDTDQYDADDEIESHSELVNVSKVVHNIPVNNDVQEKPLNDNPNRVDAVIMPSIQSYGHRSGVLPGKSKKREPKALFQTETYTHDSRYVVLYRNMARTFTEEERAEKAFLNFMQKQNNRAMKRRTRLFSSRVAPSTMSE